MATAGAAQSREIQLAHEPVFRLGSVQVTPALRQVEWPGGARTLEPRVMQVLVALSEGEIVSRDDLIARCWSGRVVGDNAIQRAISLLRQLAADTGAFEVETITKVGYRLLLKDRKPTAGPSPARADRRALLFGVAATAVAGSAVWLSAPTPARRRAKALHAAGLATRERAGDLNLRQAIAYFERATMADPGFAQAWADLAYARYEILQSLTEQDHETMIPAIRAAAQRALAIHPGNRQALLALALMEPNFRNWIGIEQRLRAALARLPDEPLLQARLGIVHLDTGRFGAAVVRFQQLAEREPLVPANRIQLGRALSYRGETDRADAILADAVRLWPVEPMVWLERFNHLLLAGRPHLALAMIQGPRAGVGGQSPLPADVAISTAKALISRSPADAREAVSSILAARNAGTLASFLAIPYLLALGAIEPAWQAIYAYYMGKRDPLSGERLPLPVHAWRRTDILFTRGAANLRADPRFAMLTKTIGLDDYWRVTGTRPDAIGGG